MTDLMLRRRAMMTAVGEQPEYVVNAKDNPEMMAVCYELGWCKSPDGITAEEAAAVTDTSFVGKFIHVPIQDFRYFINMPMSQSNPPGSSSSFGVPALLVTPNRVLGNNIWFGSASNCTIIITNKNHWPFLINRDGVTHADLIFESDRLGPNTRKVNRLFNMSPERVSIYVPDQYIDNYKADFHDNYEGRIHPISEYNGEYKQYIHVQ